MPCDNQISTQDLINAKEDATTLGEVATSRTGAESVGALIDTSTNRFSETTDTVKGRLKKMGFAVPIAYAGGVLFTTNDDVKTVSRPDDVTPTNSIQYAPFPDQLPFTTSGTWLGDDDARFFVVQDTGFSVINPEDFNAAGDGVTNDTVPFADIEATTESSLVDLRGLTYLVDAIPSGKSYLNGFFKVGVITTPAYGLRYNGKVEIAGLQPARLSESSLRIAPGYCSDGAGTPSTTFILNSRIDTDLTTTGLNALDTGVMVVGEQYFPYIVQNPSTGEVGVVISKEISTGAVTLPAGFTKLRKLPFGFIWLAAGILPEGIAAFHLTGWPDAQVEYTDMDDSAPWEVLLEGASTILATVDCTSLVPDNARQVSFHCELESTGSAGAAYLRTAGSGGNGKPVGFVSSTVGDKSYGEFSMRVTSARTISYKTAAGTKLTLRIAGYSMTEQS